MSLPPNTHKDEPPLPEDRETATSVSIMGREVNMDSIRALEKQIEGGKRYTITLKRARNLLLNISTRVPPEILGDVFAWCLVPEASCSIHSQPHFKGLQKGSHNFLLVCHHWFQVASHTPRLWSFWGNTLRDWKKYHHRWAGISPLDLVLDGGECDFHTHFDKSLQDAVRIGVMRDTIRQIHLVSDDSAILSPIISSLTPNDESAQNENIESIVWRKRGFYPVDVSDFFARSVLSKLRFLALYGNLRISSWDRLASRTTLLTTLSLEISNPSPKPAPAPTISQLFSILSSNPNLQEVTLTDAALPKDVDGSTFQVPLDRLKKLSLSGEYRRLFGLLRQLTLPETMDGFRLDCHNPTVEEISQQLGPYMRDYFRRGTRFQDTLEVFSRSPTRSVSVLVTLPYSTAALVTLAVVSDDLLPPDVAERFFVNLIASVPRERVVIFGVDINTELPEELYFTMPNIEKMQFFGLELSEGLLQPNPDGPHANTKLFPSLQSLVLDFINTDDDDDWGHLIAYLAHQTSGGQVISLQVISDPPCIPPEVVNQVEGLVENFSWCSSVDVWDE